MTKAQIAKKVSIQKGFDYSKTLQIANYLGEEKLIAGFIDMYRARLKGCNERGEKPPSMKRLLKDATAIILKHRTQNVAR